MNSTEQLLISEVATQAGVQPSALRYYESIGLLPAARRVNGRRRYDERSVQLLRVLSVSGLFITVALAYTGALQGTGDTKSPLYISIISQILVPLGICFVIQQTGTLDPIDIWLAILAGHITRCILSMLRFRQGQWRHIAVNVQ